MKRILASLLLTASLAAVTGCTDFERASFNTLSSSKAVLDTAQQDYENHTIPKTACAYSLISNGKAAQTVAVTALQDYHNVLAVKGNADAQKVVVIADIATLAPVVAQVQTLISNPGTVCGGK